MKSAELFPKRGATLVPLKGGTSDVGQLGKRIITGLMLVCIVSTLILSGVYTFYILILLIDFLSLWEFYGLYTNERTRPRKIAGSLISLIIVFSLLVWLRGGDSHFFLLVIPAVFYTFFAELFSHSKAPFEDLSLTFFGVLYITLPLSLFMAASFMVGKEGYNANFALSYFVILWLMDSGAYLAGKKWGRHKLFPRISPGKTWEGVAGSVIIALLAAAGLSFLEPALSLFSFLLLALIIVVFGTFGDLFKSMMKRSLHIKDSGRILPGHGGMLDRFDTLFGSAPFTFIFLSLYHHA